MTEIAIAVCAFGAIGCFACALLGYVADKLGDILTTEEEDV